METEEIMENQELEDETTEAYEPEEECSEGHGMAVGIALGALLIAGGYLVGKKVIKPAITKVKTVIAEHKAKAEAKKSEPKSFVIEDSEENETEK